MTAEHFDILRKAVFHQQQRNLDQAEVLYLQFLEIEPTHLDAQSNLAHLYLQRGDIVRAKELIERILSIDSNFANGDNILGIIASKEGNHKDAVTYLMRAIERGVASKFTFDSLGISTYATGDYILCAKAWRSYLQIEPFSGRALSMLMDVIKTSGDWQGLGELELKLRNFVDAREGNMLFSSLLCSELNEVQLKVAATSHSHYLRQICGSFEPPRKGKYRDGDKIRVGYFSHESGSSSLSLMAGHLYAGHNEDEFSTYVYGVGAGDGAGAGASLKNFRDISDLSDEGVADIISGDDLDILVDLGGYREGNRSRALLRRPAPVVINHLGHGGTMGSDYHNYIITDQYLLPEGNRNDVSETPLYVTCASAHVRELGGTAVKERKDYSISDDAIVFGYFGKAQKITGLMMNIWLRIMQKFPRTHLWILKHNETFDGNIIKLARLYNISESRIIFANFVSYSEHIDRLSLVDIMLDSFPYNSRGSCLEALQVGVPFVTCMGRTMHSRFGVSLLVQSGLSNFCSQNMKQYIEKVCILLQSDEQREVIRQEIRDKVEQSPVFDGARLVRELEEYYRRIVALRPE